MASVPQKIATASETGTLSRPIYFSGQILSADDFRAEQDYCVGLSRLTARAALGFGIVSGLELDVKAEEGDVSVSPGLAIDRLGNIVELSQEARLVLPSAGTAHRELRIVLRRFEELTDYRPSTGASGGEGALSMASRARSVVELALEAGPADSAAESIEIGRIRRRRSAWQVSAVGARAGRPNDRSGGLLRFFRLSWPWT